MMTRFLILAIVVFCTNDSKKTNYCGGSDSAILIDLLTEPESSITKLSDFAADIEYIPLQTTDASLIGNTKDKIIKVRDRIYIKNTEQVLQSDILCFDSKGRFLYKIAKTGRGPEEYTNIEDFDVSSDNKLLVILSSLDSRLIKYGISENGFSFQRYVSFRNPKPYRMSIVPETDKIFLAIPPWEGNEPTLSLLMNTDGDTIHIKPNCYKYDMVRKINSRALNEMLVYKKNDMVCFKETFSDTVFYVDATLNSFTPGIIFDSHGTFMTPEMRGGSKAPGNQTTWISSIFETSRYVFYWYGSRESRKRICFDKNTGKKYLLETNGEMQSLIKDDLSGGPDFNIEYSGRYCSGGKLFSFVEAITLKKYVAGEEFRNSKVRNPEKKEHLKKLAESLDEAANPVLVILSPRD